MLLTLTATAIGYADPTGRLVLALAIILAAAKLCGGLAKRLGQPAVLGELLAGVVLANLDLVGLSWFRNLASDPTLEGIAGLGVVILLFEIGLESTVQEMVRVGWRSLWVALLGVFTPWALGYGVGVVFLPEHSHYVHVFLGAVLTATSVGITARVLRDLGHSQTQEARIILGAAVIDDVLGLVILALVASLVQAADAGTSVSVGSVVLVFLKAMAFLVAALVIGSRLSPWVFGRAARIRGKGVLLATALVFCFLLSAGAAAIGLAPIVGAYAAGLILEKAHYQAFTARGEHELEELIQPIASILAPVFFVVMGLKVDLRGLGNASDIGFALALIAAAILGKQACALAGIGTSLDKLSIGIGMIPRGEVGLIFANMGMGLAVAGEPMLSPSLFSTVVLMVLVTTVVTPPALKWRLNRRRDSA